MPDTYTERSTISWGSKIAESIKSVVFGLVLFLVAFPALFINEGCYVKDMKALAQGESSVISISSDKVDPANEGKLVHLSGEAVTEEELADPDLGVSRNAIKLARNVEMYQWKERSETKEVQKVGGATEQETTYTYSKEWSPELIDSAAFKVPAGHENPDSMPFESAAWAAEEVSLGEFLLSDSLIQSIDASNDLKLDEADLEALPDDLYEETVIENGRFFMGEDPEAPQVGDLRVAFSTLPSPLVISLYSGQMGASFAPFIASNGRPLEQIEVGRHSAQAMFESAKQGSKIRTWFVRFGGFFAIACGIYLIFGPLVAMADVLPFLGNLIGGGLSLFAGVMAFGLSFITISIAWVFYRPIIGIPILIIGIASVAGFVLLRRRKVSRPGAGEARTAS